MPTQARAKLTKDHPVIGEGVPMSSASQKPIAIDDVLYSGTVNVSYSRDLDYEVLTWRVIQVNYKERYYRVRGIDGCETSIHHDDGCPRIKLYHEFNDLRINMLRGFEKEEKKTIEKIADRQLLLDTIKAGSKKVAEMMIPEVPHIVNFETGD